METVRAAEAVFGRNNHYLVIGDRVNELFAGLSLDRSLGSFQRPRHLLAACYLITIFQYIETLPDRLAVDALAQRVDWKYALHAPLKPFPLEAARLCEFRQMVSADPAGKGNLQRLLGRLAGVPQIVLCDYLDRDAGEVIAHVCRISRLENVWDTFNQTLEALAIRQPQWLRGHSLPHWYERYGHVRRNLNLGLDRHQQEALARAIGGDGFYLLEALAGSGMPEMAGLVEVSALRTVWNEQFERQLGDVVWRTEACAGCSLSGRLPVAPPEVSHAEGENR
jgi:transposase